MDTLYLFETCLYIVVIFLMFNEYILNVLYIYQSYLCLLSFLLYLYINEYNDANIRLLWMLLNLFPSAKISLITSNPSNIGFEKYYLMILEEKSDLTYIKTV